MSTSFPLYASETVSLQVNGIPYSLKVVPIVEDGTTLIGLREIFEILGASVNWDETTGSIKVKTSDTELSLIPGVKTAKKNGIPVELSAAPKQVGGNMMIPLRFVSEALGAEVNWNTANNVISINTVPEEVVEAEVIKTIEYPILTIAEEGSKITYEEAVAKALQNNLALKSIEESIKISEETQEFARDAVVVHRPPVEDYTKDEAFFITEAAHVNALISLTQADYGVAAAQYQKQIQEGVIKYQVKAAFDSIQSYKMEIEILNRTMETAKKQLDIITQKANLGLESDFKKTTEEQNYINQQKKMEVLKKSLENEYIKLNRLMGIDERERFSLEYALEFSPLEMSEIELNAHIERALVKDPTILLKGEAVKQAEYNLRLYTYSGINPADTFGAREGKLKQARLEEMQAKNELRDKIRTTYNQIKQLEEQYQIYTTNLQQAKEQYNILKTQYELGMVTELDLKQAELAILSAQVTQEKTAIQHAQLVYLLNNPYLL
jgi:hypothetical protein